VEDALEKALHDVGLIVDKNFGDVARVGWNRCARTDKGVHAAGQVISFRARMLEATTEAWIAKLNAVLPKDLNVHALVRVTRNFNAKNNCTARRYGYILPTFVLAPRETLMYVAKAPAMSEAMKAARAGVGSGSVADTIADRFVNGSAALAAAAEVRAGRARAAAGWAAGVGSSAWVEVAVAASARSAARSAGLLPPADAFQTGAAFVSAATQQWAAHATDAARSRDGYRLSTTALVRMREQLAKFKGTHAFHNFTPRLKAGDATTQRYISAVNVSEPFLLTPGDKPMEFVHITLVGQSFLLNQIRHMVGVVADVVRGAAPEFAIDLAFSAGLLKLPLAPAEGLYLDMCFFEAYDKRFGEDHPHLTRLRPAEAARCTAFKEGTIWAHMARAVVAEKPFHKYLSDLIANPVQYKYKSLMMRGASEATGFNMNARRKRARAEGAAGAGAWDAEEEEEEAGRSSAAHRMDSDSIMAPALATMRGITKGAAVSKQAKEKVQWKQKLKDDKEEDKESKRDTKRARTEGEEGEGGARVGLPIHKGSSPSAAPQIDRWHTRPQRGAGGTSRGGRGNNRGGNGGGAGFRARGGGGGGGHLPGSAPRVVSSAGGAQTWKAATR